MRTLLLAFLLISLASCASDEKRKEQAQLRLTIGTNLLNNGEYHSALAELLNAEKADPENPAVQNNLALAYMALEHPTEAQEHIVRALEIAPKFTEARNNYGRILVELGRSDEAVRELQKVLKDLTYPTPQKAWVNIGLAYFTQHNYTKSQGALRKALEIDHDNCIAYSYFGRSQFELANYREAAKTLDEAAHKCLTSNFDEPYYYSALTYYKMGKREQALARIDELLSRFPHGHYNDKAVAMRKLME